MAKPDDKPDSVQAPSDRLANLLAAGSPQGSEDASRDLIFSHIRKGRWSHINTYLFLFRFGE